MRRVRLSPLLEFFFGDQSAVTMRFRAGQASAEFTLLPRSGSTSWAVNSEYHFGADFLHVREIMRQTCE